MKPHADFGRNAAARDDRATYCKPCHNARGRAAKEKVGGERSYHLKRRYGITSDQADAMLEAQDGVCAVCAVAPAAQVDHDHETGRVRELLCFNCNGGLGQFRDDPEVLRRAAEYVEWHALADEPGADLDVETAAATSRVSSRAVSAGYSRWLAMTAG